MFTVILPQTESCAFFYPARSHDLYNQWMTSPFISFAKWLQFRTQWTLPRKTWKNGSMKRIVSLMDLKKSRRKQKSRSCTYFWVVIKVFLSLKLSFVDCPCRQFILCTRQKWLNNKSLLFPVGLVGVFSLYLVFGYGADLIVTALGFAYPAYQS